MPPSPIGFTSWFWRCGFSLFLSAGHAPAWAQWTPATNAVKLPDSLVFVAASVTNSSVVWHPVNQRYHSLRLGNSTYPLETWLPTGGLSIFQTTCGVDSRGLWYNPNTGQIERNCFSALGWATMGIDGALNATNAFTTLFAGQLQPNIQSAGAYDPVTNRVVFFDAGSAYFYNRTTGTLVQTLALTGTSLTNVTNYTVAWTGQAGYELLLIDRVAKKALFFNRTTGVFSGSSQLPAAAVTSGQFNFSYTNNKLWLLTPALRKWNAYCIWNGTGCPALLLPVELIDFQVHCTSKGAELMWSTGSERNSSHFVVERSIDMQAWASAGRIDAAGSSQRYIEYDFVDGAPDPARVSYYRLRQVDLDGTEEVSRVVPFASCGKGNALAVYPNPATDVVRVVVHGTGNAGMQQLDILDATGRLVLQRAFLGSDVPTVLEMDLGHLDPGTYEVRLSDLRGCEVMRLVKQ